MQIAKHTEQFLVYMETTVSLYHQLLTSKTAPIILAQMSGPGW